MGERTDTDEIDPAHGIVTQRIESDAARRLDLHLATGLLLPPANALHGGTRALRREVVEHDTVGNVGGKRLVDLLLVAHLDLDTEIFFMLTAVVLGTRERCGDAAGKIDMVVFEQNHIEQADTVVHAAANLDRLFLQIAEPRRGLARIEDMATRVFDTTLVAMGGGGNARHALHDVEHGALNLQKAQLLAVNTECNIARLDRVAVVKQLLETTFGVEIADNLSGYVDAGNNAGVLNNELLATHLRGRYATKRGMVAVSDVLVEPDGNQFA